jgi:hypothetical protein
MQLPLQSNCKMPPQASEYIHNRVLGDVNDIMLTHQIQGMSGTALGMFRNYQSNILKETQNAQDGLANRIAKAGTFMLPAAVGLLTSTCLQNINPYVRVAVGLGVAGAAYGLEMLQESSISFETTKAIKISDAQRNLTFAEGEMERRTKPQSEHSRTPN